MTEMTGKAAWQEREFLLTAIAFVWLGFQAAWLPAAAVVGLYSLSRGMAKWGKA